MKEGNICHNFYKILFIYPPKHLWKKKKQQTYRKQIMPLQQWDSRTLWASAVSVVTLILFIFFF